MSKYPVNAKFGRFKVISHPWKEGANRKVRCLCECGRVREVFINHLLSGRSQSCGCDPPKKHGAKGTRLYKIWTEVRQRCHNPRHIAFKRYGGRGIKVWRGWNNFVTFRNWAIANGYSDQLTIDRKNNDRDYCPNNCRWSTPAQQCQNRRKKPNTTSRFVGVTRMRQSWRATICADGKRHYLGHFPTEVQAAKVRDKAARRLHGQFAVLNFPKARA